MSYIITFLAGAIIGGIAVWIYRSQISAKVAAVEEKILPKP